MHNPATESLRAPERSRSLDRGWLPAALIWSSALALVLLVSHALLRVPISYGDQFQEIYFVLTRPLTELMSWYVHNDYYLFRPFEYVNRFLMFALFGDYLISYNYFQVLFVTVVTVLAVTLMPVRSLTDAGAAMTALLLLFGHHAFVAVMESNITLSNGMVMLFMLIALHALRSGGGMLWQLVAILVSLIAVTTKEVGLTIPVAFILGRLLGFRGVRTWTAAVLGVLLLAYLGYRFATIPPELSGRGKPGMADSLLEYLNNIVATPVIFLLGDPYDGSWPLLLGRGVQPYRCLRWAAGGLTLVVILLAYLLERRSAEARTQASGSSGTVAVGDSVNGRWLLLFLGVLGASSALGFYYTRHRFGAMALPIASLLLFYAMRSLIGRLGRPGVRAWVQVAGVLVLMSLSGLWAERSVGTFFTIRDIGGRTMVDWVENFAKYRGYQDSYPETQQHLDAFFWAAQDMPYATQYRDPRWFEYWLGSAETLNR